MKRPPEEPSRAGSDDPFPDKSVGEPNQQNCSVQLQGETAEQLFTTCDLCWGGSQQQEKFHFEAPRGTVREPPGRS